MPRRSVKREPASDQSSLDSFLQPAPKRPRRSSRPLAQQQHVDDDVQVVAVKGTGRKRKDISLSQQPTALIKTPKLEEESFEQSFPMDYGDESESQTAVMKEDPNSPEPSQTPKLNSNDIEYGLSDRDYRQIQNVNEFRDLIRRSPVKAETPDTVSGRINVKKFKKARQGNQYNNVTIIGKSDMISHQKMDDDGRPMDCGPASLGQSTPSMF